MMSTEAQIVVVIQDASREVCTYAIRWVLNGLSLKPGDMLTLVSILHQVHNPMGYKSRVDTSMLGANQKIVKDLIARKTKEYQNNLELIGICKLYEMHKIEFNIVVDSGPSPKVAALEAAKRLGATWVILDRKMKKDAKYFLEKLSCGISKMKSDNNVEKLRGPKTNKIKRFLSERLFSYDEMLPGSAEVDDLFSIELFPRRSSSSLGSSISVNSSPSIVTRIRCLHPNESGKFSIEGKRSNCDQEGTCSRGTKDSITFSSLDNSICSICKNRRLMIDSEINFSHQELFSATNGFSHINMISSGESGVVFKGKLTSTLTIVVKEHRDTSFHGQKKFQSEIEALSKARHKHVVMLLGYCLEEGRRFLVYEYVCHGSLDQHIADMSCKTLTWEGRMKIAVGASRGLHYLHRNNIIHRDIRPKNIFLTHDHEPLLGGFGLARTADTSKISSDQQLLGTFGYLAPEYVESGKPTIKADVYGFGVVLLELITGFSTADKRLKEKSLLAWARPLLKGKNYSEMIDPRIVTPSDAHQFILTVQLTERCLCKDPLQRLSMDEVVLTLEYIIKETCVAD